MVGLQIAGNILAFLTAFIACFLYFNIGMKTVYIEVFQEILHFPAITTKRGKSLWFALGPIYWALAFVVAAAVPNLRSVVIFFRRWSPSSYCHNVFSFPWPNLFGTGTKFQERCETLASVPADLNFQVIMAEMLISNQTASSPP